MTRTRRGAAVALAVASAVAFSGGTALGYYTVGIDGTSVTATAEGGTVVLAASAAPSAALHPGGPAADVVVTVTNPFSAPLEVTGLTATASGCTRPDLRVLAPGGLPFTVPERSTATQVLTGAVALGPAASDDCQGATLAVTYAVTGTV